MRGIVLSIVLFGFGCSSLRSDTAPWKPSDVSQRSARMLRQLDRLEADLHGENAEIATYGVLVERHGHAEQVACQVTDEHVREITRLDLAQRIKRAEKLKKRRSVASAGTRVGQRIASR